MPQLELPSLDFLTKVYYHTCEDGYVVWRRGTGDNVEITHIRSSRPGGGPALISYLLNALRSEPPYRGEGTVFGFTRTSNAKAHRFYRNMGFTLTLVPGVYADGAAYLFTCTYKELCDRHGVEL